MIEKKSRAFYTASFALCLAAVFVFANLHLLQPLLPELSRDFALSPLQTSWSYAIGTLTLGASLLVYGALSDALGRRTILLWSLTGMALSTLALTQVESYSSLLAWRAVQGFCLGGLPAVAIAYMGEEFSKPALVAAVGYYISANSVGGISGRVLAGWFAELNHWQWVFYPMAAGSALCVWLVWRYLPRSSYFQPKPFTLQQAMRDNWFHLRQPALLLTYLIGGLNFFIFLNQYTFVAFRLAEAPYQLSSGWIGLLFLTYLTGTVGSAISGKVSVRLHPGLGMAVGIGIMVMGTLLTLLTPLWCIVLGFFISAFGFFLCHSLASAWVNHQAVRAKASASALYLVFYYVGASSGGLFLSMFWQWAHWNGVVLGSVAVFLLTLWLSLRLRRYPQVQH